MTTTPPGWYDDGHGAMRWWDGANWTEHVATPEADEPAEQPTAVTVPLGAGFASQADTVPLHPGAAPVETATPYPGSAPYPGAAPYPDGYAGAPGEYPAGYPAAYPTEGGAFIAATEPRRSRLWIVWVILGAVVLAVVIGFSVLIPMFFMAVQSGVESSGSSSGGTSTEEPTDGVPSQTDQQAASDSVVAFNDAIQTGDCAAYFESTTQTFRDALEVTDCDEFDEAVANFARSYQDYVLTVTSVEPDGDTISVYTDETYTSPYDVDGNETAEPQDYEDHFLYVVVNSDDGWVIDESYTTDQ